jgi:hypothetical protein
LSQLKTKGSIEHSIFDSYVDKDEELAKGLSRAKDSVDKMKKFDNDIFGLGKKSES